MPYPAVANTTGLLCGRHPSGDMAPPYPPVALQQRHHVSRHGHTAASSNPDPMIAYRSRKDAARQSVLSKYSIVGFISSGASRVRCAKTPYADFALSLLLAILQAPTERFIKPFQYRKYRRIDQTILLFLRLLLSKSSSPTRKGMLLRTPDCLKARFVKSA